MLINDILYFRRIMKKKYKDIPGMFEIKGEPNIVTEIRATILDKFKDLVFEEEPHIYYLKNDRNNLFKSVTTRLGEFEHEFDSETQASKYAEKYGNTKEYWQDIWKISNLKSTITGTLCHEYGESLAYVNAGHPELILDSCKRKYIKDKNWLIPTHPKQEAIYKFQSELHPDLHLVLAEAKMFTEGMKQNLAGTADILFYYDDPTGEKSGLCIYDYKTNKELIKSYNRQVGKTLLPPFEDYIEEPQSVYTLQLSTYAIPLQDLGFKIITRRVVYLKPDGNYEIIPLADESERLRKIL